MRSSNLSRVFFVLYCIEAGTLLLFLPWSPTWDRTVMNLPFLGLRALLIHPFLRGAISGFGLVHMVWGAHDLQALVMGWRPRSKAGATPDPAPGPASDRTP